MYRSELSGFLLRVLIVSGVVVLLLLLWQARQALLLTFFAILIAVPLAAGCGYVERATPLSRGWALTLVGLALAVAIAAISLLVGAQVQGQVTELLNRLPEAVQGLQERFGLQWPTTGEGQSQSMIAQLANQALSLGAMIVDAAAAVVLIVIGGFYLAANPHVYRSGLVKLFPPHLHARADDAVLLTGHALRLWLLAQLLSMVIVGVLVGLGTWLIGLPAPIALGLVAGIVEFIPIIGPVLGAIPALIFALAEGGNAIWWTLGLFIAIQQIESNLIMPLVEKRMVRIPPALFLFAVVAVGLVFGFLGVLIAAPLTVVVYVLVKKLYVRDVLGEDTTLPGEGSTSA